MCRYALLYCEESYVKIEKVSFEEGKICAGLVACQMIPAATPILTTCSSMSSDLAEGSHMISVVEGTRLQKGPEGPRLILGPFRFVNHNCQPNCQVRSFSSYWDWVLII